MCYRSRARLILFDMPKNMLLKARPNNTELIPARGLRVKPMRELEVPADPYDDKFRERGTS